MSETEARPLLAVQYKIQNLKPDPNYYHFFQELLTEASQLIAPWDPDSSKLLEYKNELTFYEDGRNDDGLERFYKCKSAALPIIAKKLSSLDY